MNSKLLKISAFFFILTLALPIPVKALDSSVFYEPPETFGMGGISLGVTQSPRAVFANPADIDIDSAPVSSLLNPSYTVNKDFYKMKSAINKLSNENTAASAKRNMDEIKSIMGKKGYQNISANAYAVTSEGFGVTANYSETEFYTVENPVNPSVSSEVFKDLTIGFSASGKYEKEEKIFNDRAIVSWGARGKVTTRKMTKTKTYAPQFALLTADYLKDTNKHGVAFDLDLGATLHLFNELGTNLSFFAGNILGSKFSDDIGSLKREIGTGITFRPLSGDINRKEKLLLGAEYWDNGSSQTLFNKLRLGMRYKATDNLHLVTGFRGGYWTAGFNIVYHDFSLQAATYAEELGKRAGEMEDRRYSVSADLKF